ncbi:hypothetical protein CEUSTIGMA_g13820.t1 [Chlamydomonas eustigma]|uniref:Uncharacterized protein n=1 Tax=Chlamydomonas eustigma TaxID=1157962 RepID=A0A250XUD0_9CHLO|nr:hypothetical protein CEUSTIGMA_g13820.t1 [Chlamydomonas eustigma]|eukprot:GAX86410.1 hypothetical protein CEUSTIGMA_g13820.t1 [Chlamydomonas eustigma]
MIMLKQSLPATLIFQCGIQLVQPQPHDKQSYEIAENFSLTMPRPTSQQKGSVASSQQILKDVVEVAKHEALLTLSPELTSAFWSELVPLYHQKAYDVTAMWIKVKYTRGEDIPRWRLWARFFVWLFSSRLPPAPSATTSPTDPAMLQQPHSTAIANLNDPSLAAVQTSIDNITSWLDAGDSIEAILEEILVNAVPGFDLGPYAKDLDINDGVLGDQIRSLLEEQCLPQSHESCESAANFQDDLLPWMMPNGVSGISRNMAWQYGGGNSLAGCHREDANLHFVHVMPKLRMDFSELVQKRPPLEAAVARLAMDPRLQCKVCKVWLFMRSRATTYVIALNKEMATLDTDIPDLLIDSAVGDAMFKEKCYLIRPDWARVNGWQVVYMRPRDVICSDYPHSVCGGTSVMSVAWNTCQIESLVRYLVASYELSAYRRQQRQALVAMDLKQLDFSMKKKILSR